MVGNVYVGFADSLLFVGGWHAMNGFNGMMNTMNMVNIVVECLGW